MDTVAVDALGTANGPTPGCSPSGSWSRPCCPDRAPGDADHDRAPADRPDL